ncbi:UDP-glucose dehydrogenase family protein [Parageobacillus thermoglucosidasius]|uniref:UDP-glucose dehydrogenase family protein n=1 Tax=Parageobacillus thermoglucosidasius TaxID=1426 RepID=UPI000E151EC2|nr:UDP-glucose/GDP-mannose dehydrogenase family protein [Parageobacillus thermoglucosidasius]MED4905371.1 UDP-glucose/GDP-mannose dehydrogenase family protein [Parageobacillus thermoglucosidasius]MED4913556.1 UDP-glucose/GDP-mannose dehydrogenase family protein [Parageobacillus thermoglucosidasius]MED4944037.1 UDP-glucose/GDP-mannose dehydrogenase family protein [Parageobacillus thermoglucosidasius]MED4984444.1 UDP-glucose/GDP-mannose dehydrogenase family protein [Parageobacillus thermoglucosid
MDIAVAGAGYVGLVTAACLAEKGHKVACVDVDAGKVALLQSGKSPIYEPGLEELLKKNRERLLFTTDGAAAYRRADVIIIAVGTPEEPDGSVNLRYVREAAKQIAEAAEKDCVVAVKSTVPVGTGDQVERWIEENRKNPVHIEVVANPEFLSQGTAVKDMLHASRIVLGVESPLAEKVMKEVYDPFALPYVVTDRKSAEMVKYAANVFLALKISYINEIANVCEMVGANIEDVTAGMGMDPRIGSQFLRAGIGYGGSCFPKDTKALHWLAAGSGYELKTVQAAMEVNERQKVKLIEKARTYVNHFRGLEVAVLGLTFKPGTDDIREAPSLANIAVLLEEGANVRVWDPAGMENARRVFQKEVVYCSTIAEAITNADICFIFTEWQEIRQFDIRQYAALMKTPLVLDGRNCYSLDSAREAGIIYESVGRERVCPAEVRCRLLENADVRNG